LNISRHHNGVAAGTGEVDKLSLPVLLLTGDDDTVMPPDIAHANAAAIGGNAQVEILPHCGHSPLTDDPDALARAILVFLQ
jgi:pimeloyl-ACP methyl ester carboxylesterase